MDARQTVEELVARADALYHDLDFGAVKAWRDRTGGKVIGCLPTYSPKELVHAAGMLPVHLRGAGDQLEIIRGDAYFQSYICQMPRGIIELALTHRLDGFDGFVFPAICDVIRNLSGIWQLLFPGKLARYLDVPQNFDVEVGGRFYAEELGRLLADLEKLGGRPVTDEALRASIAAYNANRRSVGALMALRAEKPWLVPADEAYLVLRAGDVLPVEEHTAMVDRYVSLVPQLDRPMRDHSRVVVSGAFCEQPPLGLIKTLERAGCYIVWDDMTIHCRFIHGDVATDGDPKLALARAFIERAVESASVYSCRGAKGAELCQTVKSSGAQGVIFAAPSFCDPALLDQPMLQAALDQQRIPWTAFKYAENLGQFQVIREQAGTFSDSIRLWGTEMTTVDKEPSMVKQKEMIGAHFDRLSTAREDGKKVVYTFVPGNLTELLLAFDVLPVYPEINALQSAMRKKSGDFITEAERIGHSEDVCTYVKCDIGMKHKGNIGPTGQPLPKPDLLLLSYTGCFTFLKWFELLREEYQCPVVLLHTPYQADGEITPSMREYMVKQLRSEVIPALEKLTGKNFDEDRLKELLKLSARAEDDMVSVLQSAKHRPSPIDAYFGGVYYIGPMFTAFRGTQGAVDYYSLLRDEVEGRVARGEGPITPEGPMTSEKYRLVVEGPPNWTDFREFWRMFSEEGAVVVASTYTKVGGVYDFGFRHDPHDPLGTLADYCMGVYTNRSLPQRVNMLEHYVREYGADGVLVNSVKSCNSFSAGQLVMLREVEKRTGIAGGFIETDLVDARYFSAANVKNRIESYLQMIQQKRGGHAQEATL